MKKRLHIIMSEKAFYLPYVLFISIIVLSLMTTSIVIYKHEVKITKNLMEQIEIETLIQMARKKFIDDELYIEMESGQINYTFPNGVVYIDYHLATEEVVSAHFHAVTNNQVSIDIIHEMKIITEPI